MSLTPTEVAQFNSVWRKLLNYNGLGNTLEALGDALNTTGPVQHTGTAPPTTGTWAQNTIFWNSDSTAGSVIGWVCTVAGNPGVWNAFGPISNVST
jgi:hypothetical protein